MTVVQYTLETGRTHQLRIHSKYIGHPIVGDSLYGNESNLISIKVTSSKKMPESKKITRVTCDLEITYKENNIKLKGIKIYTMKKGIENYIIGIDPESIELEKIIVLLSVK